MFPEESKQPSSNDGLVAEVEQFIDDYQLFTGVRRLIVGCSGGADSTVLLDILLALAPRFELELAVCHLNHGLRAAALEDERHVRSLAEAAGAPFFVERADLTKERGSVEAVASMC